MANPWTKKNPFLSMWLSGANAVTGRARRQTKAAATRQQTEFRKQSMRMATNAWLSMFKPPKRR